MRKALNKILNLINSKRTYTGNKRKHFGLIIPEYCKCGRYEPKSTKGIIIDKCKHCGGEKEQPKF